MRGPGNVPDAGNLHTDALRNSSVCGESLFGHRNLHCIRLITNHHDLLHLGRVQILCRVSCNIKSQRLTSHFILTSNPPVRSWPEKLTRWKRGTNVSLDIMIPVNSEI